MTAVSAGSLPTRGDRCHPRVLARAILISLLGPLLLGACTTLFMWPDRVQRSSPAALGFDHQDVWLHTDDGYRVHAWHLKAERPRRGMVLFLHGTTRNNSAYVKSVAWLTKHGFDVFMFDPRGYGRSEGNAEITGAHRDADTALAYLANQACGELIVFGQSLGAAMAIYTVANAAAKHCVRGVIADSPFGSYRAVARDQLPKKWWTWLLRVPMTYLVSERFSPERFVAGISPTPLLLVHGEADALIPARHSRRLFEAAAEPRELWLFPDVAHVHMIRDPAIRERLVEWMIAVVADPDDGAGWRVASPSGGPPTHPASPSAALAANLSQRVPARFPRRACSGDPLPSGSAVSAPPCALPESPRPGVHAHRHAARR
jgi:uncharacterized protein